MLKVLARSGIITQLSVILALLVLYFVTPQAGFVSQTQKLHLAPFGEWIFNQLNAFPSLAWPSSVMLLIMNAFSFNAILIKHDIAPRQSLLPSAVYIFLLLFTAGGNYLAPVLISSLLLLFSLHSIMDMYGKLYPYTRILNATLAIAIASMIFFPLILFAVMLWISFFTFRINAWRDWAISLLGMAMPFFYLSLLYLWNNNLVYGLRTYERLWYELNFTLPHLSVQEYSALALIGFWTIISASRFLSDTADRLISIRKKMWIISHFALIALASVLLSGSSMLVMLPLIFIPASAMMTHAFANQRRAWLHDLCFLLTLAAIMLNRISF